jgi:hypothetical protein
LNNNNNNSNTVFKKTFFLSRSVPIEGKFKDKRDENHTKPTSFGGRLIMKKKEISFSNNSIIDLLSGEDIYMNIKIIMIPAMPCKYRIKIYQKKKNLCKVWRTDEKLKKKNKS